MQESLISLIALFLFSLVTMILFVRRLNSFSNVITTQLSDKTSSLGSGQDRLEKALRDEINQSRGESNNTSKELRLEIAASIKSFGESIFLTINTQSTSQTTQLNQFASQISTLKEMTQKNITEMREAVDIRLQKIQSDNNLKLDEMRMTVDEKLQGTLEKRLSESFQIVSDRLEKVHQGLGEMQTLTTGVGDLKRMLTNVKSRGTWGEYQLGNILEQFLSPEQYEANVAVKPRGSERVEFAIKMPGQGDADTFVYLPIDSKFPQEDYQRLLSAQEAADPEAAKASGDALETSIRREARRICDKYIGDRTTPFAIMFVPTEGLYSEILRRPGLADRVQLDHKVLIAGPMTLTALVNSLQMGFKTLAIQKRSSEIWKHLSVVRNQFSGFTAILENVQKKLENASKEVESATKKSRTIEKKLSNFEALPSEGSEGKSLTEKASDNR